MTIYFKHKELTKALQKFEEIAFATIFGSSQDEIVNDGSDIDIAVYFIKSEKELELRLQIIAELEKIIPSFSNYDLVILNYANSILAMQAIQGKLLFVNDEYKNLYASFYSQTCRQYEDDSYWMKKQLEYRGYEVQWNN
jgi:predicted nucleotidyltransferase